MEKESKELTMEEQMVEMVKLVVELASRSNQLFEVCSFPALSMKAAEECINLNNAVIEKFVKREEKEDESKDTGENNTDVSIPDKSDSEG